VNSNCCLDVTFAEIMENLQRVIYQDLGRISYKTAWDYQSQLQKQVIDAKLAERKRLEATPSVSADFVYRVSDIDLETRNSKLETRNPHYLLFCEHNPVYTLGKSGSIDHLLLNEAELAARDIEFFRINRGGDITYHGPGQITGYPIFDMELFFTDVHKYVRYLEEAVIRTMADLGLEGYRIKEFTGVWINTKADGKARKICAIGVHFSRWVSLHGFAFNVNTDLNYFKNIIPCGIADEDKDVTSLSTELGREIDINQVKHILKGHFAELFNYTYAV
jgi:lipoyl(octanoyl) transferase